MAFYQRMETLPKRYDPEELIERVRDKIKNTYVSLIPDEQWTQMVKKEVDSFFAERDGDSRGYRISTFQQVVYNELELKAKEIAKQYFNSISNHEWNNGQVCPGEFVKQLFAEKSGEILLNVLGGMVQCAINNAPSLR